MKINRLSSGCIYGLENTAKFKDVTLQVRFYYPWNKENAAYGSLIAGFICEQTAKYPTKQALSDHLDQLYGANLGVENINLGNCGCLCFVLKVVNGRFVSEELFTRQLTTIKEVITDPAREADGFLASLFNEAQANMLAYIKRQKDEPEQYALLRAREIYGAEQPLAVPPYGAEKIIKKAKNNEVYKWYIKLLEEAAMEVFAVGEINVEEEKALAKFVRSLGHDRPTALPDFCYHKPFFAYNEVREEAQVDQSQVLVMYNGAVNIGDDDYFKLAVGCVLFGQLPTSLLFQEVREKHSLAYSVYSRLLRYEGGMMVATGVARKNIAKTVKLINKLFARMRKGDFSEELLKTATDLLINSQLTYFDEPGGYIHETVNLLHCRADLTVAKTIEEIRKVTKEEVVSAFRELIPETLYIYQQADKQ